MRMVDLIQKKRDGQSLSEAEIQFMIKGYTADEIPDYQMSAFAMAVYFQGMSEEETAQLTMAMADSGDTVDLSPIEGVIVDKHSTGGVGDKTSLIIAPLVASVGVPVAKMSGRGLGHTGGTVDKLEGIPGFQIEMTREQFIDNVNTLKLALVGQSGNLTPADKKLYALRDVTATVNSIPLIASSIMSKKIASGADAIVLDVKVGSGAFMKSLEDARKLATTMVQIGKHLGRRTVAVLSDMNQPLGHEIGNANEVVEAMQVLTGMGEARLTEISLTLASHMAVLGGAFDDLEQARQELTAKLKNGQALATFRTFIEAQGGNPDIVDRHELLPQAKHHLEVRSEKEGYVSAMDAESIGIAAMLLGAGRETKEDRIDYAAGISIHKKVGDFVKAGDLLVELHTNREQAARAEEMARSAYEFVDSPVEVKPMIYEIIE
ncbi:pyrimidine-nucleoside phosphorylase [Marinicrinis sediminis]|uniref:Pyrimidine-nucleoside phosphorylase n=1 Tax=Marinicrinis sediminis TaxID=1652465 RepID=A0ABW5RD01_9BACL